MPLPPKIGQYEIVDLIGKGGMGEIYKAVDTRMYGRVVAIKVTSLSLAEDHRAMSRFETEVRTAANLQHPNIVTIHDRGEFEGRPYFVMEYLEGVDLERLIKDRTLRDHEGRLEIAIQICEALAYAHRHGVVHRDIKPANIMVVTKGGADQVKLLDFGIVHVARADATGTNIQPGTMLYMSPEQLQDEKVDPRSDLFSLGIVLYELFTGKHPFAARSAHLVTSNILRETPPSARSLDPAIPQALDELLAHLLRKASAERPAGAEAGSAALRDILKEHRSRRIVPEVQIPDNLDAVTAQLVETVLKWSRKREEDGAIPEALEGYRRAELLAPGAGWLRQKIQSLEGRAPGPAASSAAAPASPGESSEPRGLDRDEFVRLRLVEAEQELDEGALDRASAVLAKILRRYPDESRAVALLERVMVITGKGIPYKTYRAAVKQARQALLASSFDEARKAHAIASALWPDDEDVVSLEQEIRERVESEIAFLMDRAERLLEGARTLDGKEQAGLQHLREAQGLLERAEQLGAGPSRTRGLRDRVASTEVLHRERIDRRERLELERQQAIQNEIAKLLEQARSLVREAESKEAAGGDGLHPASALCERADEILGRALTLYPGQPEALEQRARIDRMRRGLTERIAEEERRRADLRAGIEAARAMLREAAILADGTEAEVSRSARLLEELQGRVRALSSLAPGDRDVREIETAAVSLLAVTVSRIERQREERARRERLEGLLVEARGLLSSALARSRETEVDIERSLEEGGRADRVLEEVVRLEVGHPQAASLREQCESLLRDLKDGVEQLRRARQLEEERGRESAVLAEKRARADFHLGRSRKLRAEARSLDAHEAPDRVLALLDQAREELRSVLGLCPEDREVKAELETIEQLRLKVDSNRRRVELERKREGIEARLRKARGLLAGRQPKKALGILELLEKEFPEGEEQALRRETGVLKTEAAGILASQRGSHVRWVAAAGTLVLLVAGSVVGYQWWQRSPAEEDSTRLAPAAAPVPVTPSTDLPEEQENPPAPETEVPAAGVEPPPEQKPSRPTPEPPVAEPPRTARVIEEPRPRASAPSTTDEAMPPPPAAQSSKPDRQLDTGRAALPLPSPASPKSPPQVVAEKPRPPTEQSPHEKPASIPGSAPVSGSDVIKDVHDLRTKASAMPQGDPRRIETLRQALSKLERAPSGKERETLRNQLEEDHLLSQVSQTLQKWEAAMEARDADAVARVRRDLDVKKLRAAFRDYKEQELSVSDVVLEKKNEAFVEASFRYQARVIPKSGTVNHFTAGCRVAMVREGDAWFIRDLKCENR